MSADSPRVKITFRLLQDDEGWPPVPWELLWAMPRADDSFELDNIPFFAKGVAAGDVVAVSRDDGQLIFDGVLASGGHSTVRVIMYDLAEREAMQEALHHLGCATEGSHVPSLVAVDVPPEADYLRVIKLLDEKTASDILEYEEGVVRHRLNG